MYTSICMYMCAHICMYVCAYMYMCIYICCNLIGIRLETTPNPSTDEW